MPEERCVLPLSEGDAHEVVQLLHLPAGVRHDVLVLGQVVAEMKSSFNVLLLSLTDMTILANSSDIVYFSLGMTFLIS